MTMSNTLIAEYERIDRGHSEALKWATARTVLGPSVIRVFAPGSIAELLPALVSVDVDALPGLANEIEFRVWYERELERVAEAIRSRNGPDNSRVYPGYKWGHATKLLTLYVNAMVLNTRCFLDSMVERIQSWLYVPIDSVVMGRLQKLGHRLPFNLINQIDSAEKFYAVQDLLGQAATAAGVSRVWFDDNWGDRRGGR